MEPSIEKIILRYIENKATDSEKETLLGWLQESEEHRLTFARTARSWEETAVPEPDRINRQQQRLRFGIRLRERTTKWYRTLSAAAAAAVCFLTVWLFAPQLMSGTVTVATVDGKQQFVLPDSSMVWLNRNSQLTYSERFSKNREVHLEGEGYFDVRKDSAHPFVVQSDHFKVTVLGTRFTVTDHAGQALGEVVLEEGSVRLHAKDLPGDYLLHPDERMVYNKRNGTGSVEPVTAANFTNWKDSRLVFSGTQLQDVFVQLEKWYGITITCMNDALLDVPVSLTVDSETQEEVFTLLEMIVPFEYRTDGTNIIVR